MKHKLFVRVALFALFILTASVTILAQYEDWNDEEQLNYNMASPLMGGMVVTSSTLDQRFPAAAAVNGDRKGLGWGNGTGGWNDGTPNSYPDVLEIDFDVPKDIIELDVFTLQDDYLNPVDPTFDLVFTKFGITAFDLQYWNDSLNDWSWFAGRVTGNDKVWRQFRRTTPVTTRKVRIVVLDSLSADYSNKWSRIVEFEAWGRNSGSEKDAPPPSGNPGNCDGDKQNPCEMTMTLLNALQGQPPPSAYNPVSKGGYWYGHLDWDYGSWDQNSSQNLPLLAHAIALARLPDTSNDSGKSADDVMRWWIDFLTCQNSADQCKPGLNTKQYLKYFKGSELFSDVYDGAANRAVAAVHFWAVHQCRPGDPLNKYCNQALNSELLNQSRLYLRNTWALYALGAGNRNGTNLEHRTLDGSGDRQLRNCHFTSRITYNGMVLPLAGLRSFPRLACVDERATIFARAIGWPHSYDVAKEWDIVPGAAPQRGQQLSQYLLLEYLEQNFPADIGVNVLGLTSAQQDLIKDVMNTGGIASGNLDFLVSFLHDIRSVTNYHFLAWSGASGQQVRATLLEQNRNGGETAIYGALFNQTDGANQTQGRLRLLFPWTVQVPPDAICSDGKLANAFRRAITVGAAGLSPSIAPTILTASNLGTYEQPRTECGTFTHGRISEQLDLTVPLGHWFYHVVTSRGSAPQRRL